MLRRIGKIENPEILVKAIDTAFADTEFDELDPVLAPLDTELEPTIRVTSFLSREKTGHDTAKNCGVLVSQLHVQLEEVGTSATQKGEALVVEWDDGQRLIYDITDERAGTVIDRASIRYKEIAPDEHAAFKSSIQAALASVTTII